MTVIRQYLDSDMPAFLARFLRVADTIFGGCDDRFEALLMSVEIFGPYGERKRFEKIE